MAGKYLHMPGGIKGDNIIRLHGRARNLHARRANGHAWDSQAGNVWTFSQQLFNLRNRHMSFNHVTIDDGGVARVEPGGDIISAFDGSQVTDIVDLHRVAVVLKVGYPITTTTSGW